MGHGRLESILGSSKSPGIDPITRPKLRAQLLFHVDEKSALWLLLEENMRKT